MAATRRRRPFTTALREAGADPGQLFDPNVYEGVATSPSDGAEPGTVVRELRRGWRFGDELPRPAQFVVAAFLKAADPWQ